MKWKKENEYLATSNTMPAYKVAKYNVHPKYPVYRASFKGEFLGRETECPKEARQICERHHTITQEAKEFTNGPKDPA